MGFVKKVGRAVTWFPRHLRDNPKAYATVDADGRSWLF